MSRNDAGWCRCPNCTHKLFYNRYKYNEFSIEIKCSSCKKIIEIEYDWKEGTRYDTNDGRTYYTSSHD